MLAERDTWYRGKTRREEILRIRIVDSYKPTGEETERWAANEHDTGKIMCYIVGTELIIAGNGSGSIKANENSSCMFNYRNHHDEWIYFTSLENIFGLEPIDTSSVTNMEDMFQGYINLTNIDGLANWNVSNVEAMGGMFHDCKNLTNIDVLKNWNVHSTTDMRDMFINSCISLEDTPDWYNG